MTEKELEEIKLIIMNTESEHCDCGFGEHCYKCDGTEKRLLQLICSNLGVICCTRYESTALDEKEFIE